MGNALADGGTASVPINIDPKVSAEEVIHSPLHASISTIDRKSLCEAEVWNISFWKAVWTIGLKDWGISLLKASYTWSSLGVCLFLFDIIVNDSEEETLIRFANDTNREGVADRPGNRAAI